MSDESPEVIRRYLRAADADDVEALAGCFAPDGYVVDEDETYRGRDEIMGWRRAVARKWTYTSELTGTEPADDGEHRAFVHIEGNFPGGVADLTYRFTVRDGLIAALTIGA